MFAKEILHRVSGWRFYVDVKAKNNSGSLGFGEFTEVTGLSVSRETESLSEGGFNLAIHALPKRVSYDNITLKRGIINLDMWDWFANTSQLPDVRNFTIHLASTDGKEALRWEVWDAYPVKWTGPTLDASAGDTLAVEEIEISHSGFKLSKEDGFPAAEMNLGI